jgi:hypothetical protein
MKATQSCITSAQMNARSCGKNQAGSLCERVIISHQCWHVMNNIIFLTFLGFCLGVRLWWLADEYIKEKVVRETSRDDCIHIATATINNVDLLISWNFKHIVNVERIRGYNSIGAL